MEALERPGGPQASGTTRDVTERASALEEYRPRLLATAWALVGYRADAEDIVQATYEHALRHLAGLRSDAALWSWLVTIEMHEAFRWRRRMVRALTTTLQEQEPPAVPDSTNAVDLRDAVNHLPSRVRIAIVLHYMADLPVAQVATAMGTSENTVKAQLKVGLRRLKETQS